MLSSMTETGCLKMKKNKKEKAAGFWGTVAMTIGPMGIWTLLFFIFPFIYIMIVSFCSIDQFGNVVYDFTTKSYITLLKPTYLKIILNTIKMALIVTVLVVVIAYPYAYIASRAKKSIQNLMIIGIMIPFWVNSLLRIYAIMNITSKNGIINSLLLSIGIIDQPLQILYSNTAVYIGLVYSLLPMMIMPLYTCLQKIDPAVFEAARDLGASSFQLFIRVVFPLSIPGIMGGIILVFVPAMFNFYIADALGGGKTIIIGNLISNQFSIAKNWPFGAALAVVIMLFSTLIIIIKNIVSKKTEVN